MDEPRMTLEESLSNMNSCRIAVTLVDLALTGAKEGLLGIEDKVKKLPKGLLRKSLDLIVGGADPKMIDELFRNTLKKYAPNSTTYHDIKYMQSGVELLQEGYSAPEIFYKLAQYFSPSSRPLTNEEIEKFLK